MYQPDKSKIKNFYNQFTNPSGKSPMPTTLGGFLGDKPKSIKELFGGFSPSPTPNIDLNNAPVGPMTPYQQNAPVQGPVKPAPSAPLAPSNQLFQQTPITQPIQPTTPSSNIPSQYLKEDGTPMTPQEYVERVKGEMKSRVGQGDIATYAVGQFNDEGKTAEQLSNEARQLGNAKGDMASGETDPYKIASRSGIAYSPEELKAIENAAAGIYDPALTTAIGKLEAKQTADAEDAKWKRELDKLEITHKNDLEKLAKSFEYDTAIQQMKINADKASAAGAISPYQDERSVRTVESIDDIMNDVNKWTTGWGSLLKSIPSTDAKAFNAKLSTLKSSIAFGELTAMREASKTGGALGNVSNIELNLLENALAGLDSAQSPEDVKTQLTKAKDSINRWRQAQGAAPLGQSTAPAAPVIVQADDGTLIEIVD